MLLRCLNSKEIKLQSSINVICIIFDLIFFSWKLKENKYSKFGTNLDTLSSVEYDMKSTMVKNLPTAVTFEFFSIISKAVFGRIISVSEQIESKFSSTDPDFLNSRRFPAGFQLVSDRFPAGFRQVSSRFSSTDPDFLNSIGQSDKSLLLLGLK